MPVRVAQPEDVDEITAMVIEHAAQEGARDLCHLDREATADALFGADTNLYGLIAFPVAAPATRAGFALWYPTFSSWEGRAGIWLEDLFVRPRFRRHGLGRGLLDELRSRTAGRVEWDVLDTNADAQAFYRRVGALPVPGWVRFRWLP